MKQYKIITFITFAAFVLIVLITIFSPFSGLTNKASAQNTGSLRLVTTTSNFSFLKDLMQGDTDPDVRELQKILNASSDTVVSQSGAGSPGQESTYFGALTKEAVIKFQEKYRSEILIPNGLTVGNGIVGKATRTKLNLLLGVSPTLDSVGFPQSRASIPATYVAPTVIATPSSNPVISTQPAISVCSFVELLINIGAITSSKANAARSVFSCNTVNVITNPSSSVDLRINGQNGPVTVNPNSTITISWNTSGVVSCTNESNENKSLSGSLNFTIGTSNHTFVLACRTMSGNSIFDSVLVNVNNNITASSTPNQNQNFSTSTPGLAPVVDIKINSQDNYLDKPTFTGGGYMISWTSENVTNCSGSASPTVSVWNNCHISQSGSEWLTISSSTIFTVTCRTASTTMSDTAMLVIDNSYLDALASSTNSSFLNGVDPWASSSAWTTASSTPDFSDIDVSQQVGTTVFGGTISMFGMCPGIKEPTYKIGIEGTKPFTGWYVYYAKNKLATTTSEDASRTSKVPFIVGAPILGSALNDGGPSCSITLSAPNTNPLVSLLYFKNLGYIQEFGTNPKYGSSQ